MSEPTLTICIPIGPGHEHTAERAKNSVKAQTVRVHGQAYYDADGRGAGWTRNQLLKKVDTPYVTFLDADDWLVEDFAAVMLTELKNQEVSGRYVYSSWYEVTNVGTVEVHAPERCYCFDNGWQVHLVNAVLPTAWVKAIGGFDEQMPGMEDTDFFHKLHESGHCGWRIDKPLMYYSADGMRSVAFRNRPDYLQTKERIGRRYHKQYMSCCGGQAVPNTGPFNEKQPGDVLAAVLGAQFITYVGKASRRIYENTGHGQYVWADPGDVAMDPARFRLVDENVIDANQSSAAQFGAFMNAQRNNVQVPQATPVQRTINPADLAKLAGFFDNE